MSEPLQATRLGGLIHNSNGDVLVSFCSKLNYIASPAMAEAFALRKALLLCMELQFPKVAFEGDCLKVITATNSTEPEGDELHYIISYIRKIL